MFCVMDVDILHKVRPAVTTTLKFLRWLIPCSILSICMQTAWSLAAGVSAHFLDRWLNRAPPCPSFACPACPTVQVALTCNGAAYADRANVTADTPWVFIAAAVVISFGLGCCASYVILFKKKSAPRCPRGKEEVDSTALAVRTGPLTPARRRDGHT